MSTGKVWPIEEIVETGDAKALHLLSDVLQKQLDYRDALRKLQEHLREPQSATSQSQPAARTVPVGVLNPASISQRCLKVVIDAGGQEVTTEKIADVVGVTVIQVRGSLKRFVTEGKVSKPRRGFWRYEVGRQNGHVDQSPIEN